MENKAILAAYEDHLITEAEAIEQADVMRIEDLYASVPKTYFQDTAADGRSLNIVEAVHAAHG